MRRLKQFLSDEENLYPIIIMACLMGYFCFFVYAGFRIAEM